ncbi:hypothetical protein TNCV_666341 [Trichonephila clavipes]|uniref:Uncharacterized protein n=1 Tax=Trichonephila clavipes TaxID=2585209 RepID=A0A8X6VCA7_TRICX|nr:hypothetical protein TNCV_666341 [Trichonephila clavipes]
MGRLSGIRLWDYKRENLENKSKQEVFMEESSKEGTSPRGAVLPDMMMRMNCRHPTSVSWGKLPTRTTQPTSRIGTLTSTFAGLKEDTCTKDSLAADQR